MALVFFESRASGSRGSWAVFDQSDIRELEPHSRVYLCTVERRYGLWPNNISLASAVGY